MAELIVICICLLLNAVFASIEMAFVTIRRTELKQKAKRGSRNALRLLQLRQRPERALSVIQIGITLVGAISAAVGGAGAEETLSPIFEERFGMKEHLAEALAIAAIVAPLTYLSVVLGELVPKTIALRYPQAVLRFGTTVLVVGSKVLGPVVTVFEVSTRFILKLVLRNAGTPTSDENDESAVSLEDMEHHQRQYILNLANIESKKIRDIYLPWSKVQSVANNERFGQILHKVIDSGHTRLPVLDESGKKVVGILHTKEFLSFVDSGNTDWQSIVRPAAHVRLEDELLAVLRNLQSHRQHMAVITRPGEPLGLVTVEDILEEIVGDLFDEDDDGLVRSLLAQRSRNRSDKVRAFGSAQKTREGDSPEGGAPRKAALS